MTTNDAQQKNSGPEVIPKPHGSISTYVNHKCRCDECRLAWAAKHREHRARRRLALANGEVSPVHGRNSTYVNYGCRCSECSAVHAEVMKRRWERDRG